MTDRPYIPRCLEDWHRGMSSSSFDTTFRACALMIKTGARSRNASLTRETVALTRGMEPGDGGQSSRPSRLTIFRGMSRVPGDLPGDVPGDGRQSEQSVCDQTN